MLKTAVGDLSEDSDLCSQPTMTRLENHVGRRTQYDIGHLFLKEFVASYETVPKRIVMDVDSCAVTYFAEERNTFRYKLEK